MLAAVPAGGARAQEPEPAPAVPSNGDNPATVATIAAFFDRSGTDRLLVSRSAQGVTVRGRLVDAGGRGISAAVLDVRLRVTSPWATPSSPAGPLTAADGSFTLRLPSRRVSRQIVLSYRPDLAAPDVAATSVMTLRVRAALTLRLGARVVPRGGSLGFSGRLEGGPLPRLGKVIELQARDRGARRWLTFRTLRVRRRDGRFRARHTFRRARGPLSLEFRARARADGAFPFATGASRALRVRVR